MNLGAGISRGSQGPRPGNRCGANLLAFSLQPLAFRLGCLKTLAVSGLVMMFAAALFAAENLLPQRVLYIGQRAPEFEPFLKNHFAGVHSVSRDAFKPAQAQAFDVVLLDWPQSGTTRGAWLDGAPLGRREGWGKPTVLLGSAGLNLAVTWKVKGGAGCTCLAPVACVLRDHPIFQSPLPIDIHATTDVPMPEAFATELKSATLPVLPLVDGIRQYHTVINDYARGWTTYYYEFADLPEVEVFCGGINEKTPRAAAFWRQGNLLHFGFEQSPAQLNDPGRAMLVNAIVYISRFTQDRPIDITPSVFGPEKIATTRERALRLFFTYPQEVPGWFSAAALAGLDRQDAPAAQAWLAAARPWLHPNSENLLEIDPEARALGTPCDAPEFLPKTIAALRGEATRARAETLLARYVYQPLGATAGADAWEKWWRENSPYVFYSEAGGYRWYIDPLAKQRGIPTKDLRGPARADVGPAVGGPPKK